MLCRLINLIKYPSVCSSAKSFKEKRRKRVPVFFAPSRLCERYFFAQRREARKGISCISLLLLYPLSATAQYLYRLIITSGGAAKYCQALSAFSLVNLPLNTTSLYFSTYTFPGSSNQSLSFVGSKLANRSPRS